MSYQHLIVGGAAINTTPLDWENNIQNILTAIRIASAEQVSILCLPELCITGYGCEDMFFAPWVAEHALALLVERVVPAVHNMAVAVGLPLACKGKLYNAVALIENGRLLGFYAKQHLASTGVYYEPRWFTPWPGNSTVYLQWRGSEFVISATPFTLSNGLKVGFEICEDAWQGSRRPAMVCTEKADVLLNPSASHFEFDKSMQRRRIVQQGSEAIEGVYVYANLLGNESGRVIYDGEILIAESGLLVAANKHFSFKDVNVVTARVPNQKTAEVPGLNTKEEQMQKAIALALFDYMRKSRSRGFTLSLSGGADSAACAVLVSEMARLGVAELGAEGFTAKSGFDLRASHMMYDLLACAYQSTENSSHITFKAASALAQELGAAFYHWSVNEVVELSKNIFTQATGYTLSWDEDDLLLQNIQSRSRSPIIWMLANKRRSLLITTGNRSEASVGYCTMDGDTSGGIAPISGIDKHYIRQWLLWAEKSLGYASLKYVNEQAPTAELRPLAAKQTDEADLMPYALLQQIEYLAVCEKKHPSEILDILCEKEAYTRAYIETNVNRFFNMWTANQWKRERLAVGFHLDTYSVDSRGWCRYPVLSKSPSV